MSAFGRKSGSLMDRMSKALNAVGIKAPWRVRAGWWGPPVPSAAAAALAVPTAARPRSLPALGSAAQYTGPVSGPEYLSHLPRAVDYRGIAPA